eukprot:SAG22_NODE_118_length_19263_cov_16.155813_14_plen_104_part_00
MFLCLSLRFHCSKNGALQSDYSRRFTNDVGIARYKRLTDLIKSKLPRALVGANYSPTGYAIGPADGQPYCHAYLGIVFQWIELFRKGGMTMPWSEVMPGSVAV